MPPLQTGVLQLGGRFPTWRKEEHNLKELLHFVKSIFFLRDFGCEPHLALNPDALKL